MKNIHKSLFNLIEIFGNTNRLETKSINLESHCDQKHHHDFYCDAEKPFISL